MRMAGELANQATGWEMRGGIAEWLGRAGYGLFYLILAALLIGLPALALWEGYRWLTG